MSDHDKDRGLMDSVKDALGIGEDDEARRESERRDTAHGAERGAAGAGATGTRAGDGGVAGTGRGTTTDPGRMDEPGTRDRL